MGLKIVEHKKIKIYSENVNPEGVVDYEFQKYSRIKPRSFPNKKDLDLPCYKMQEVERSLYLEADYYIGLDWLIEGERFVQVFPKVNSKVIMAFNESLNVDDVPEINTAKEEEFEIQDEDFRELNYLKMFMDAMEHPIIASQIDGLMFIDWEGKEIEINQKEDLLTPFIVVQFLNLLKQIVRKGLKKSYYKVREHLNNRVKGKILVGEHIKMNVLKNRPTKTYCEYQKFGSDSVENRFLKKVLGFVQQYIAVNAQPFKGFKVSLNQMINYCTPVFEEISDTINDYELKHIKSNPFFKEYKEAIKIGQYILKRFAYNISNASKEKIKTPPFWIDTPRLFELYVYHHLLTVFDAKEVKYHFSTYGNELDFLITTQGKEMVVDAKYKLHYKAGHVHQDIRQVSGYARLSKVYNDLGMKDSDSLISCLIIYPDTSDCYENYKFNVGLKKAVRAYKEIYKIGIPMPWLE